MSKFENRELIDQMHALNHSMTGICFSIAMTDETGIKVYERKNQPCYGELRTYGKDSTRPKDYRPRDLHAPFPKGTPEAVGVRFTQFQGGTPTSDSDDYIRAYFGNESPWLKGYGSSENLEWTLNKTGNIIGFVLLDTEIDPTVLVSSLINFRNIHKFGRYNEFRKLTGASEKEAIIALLYSSDHYMGKDTFVPMIASYSMSSRPDFKRMFDQNPRELTGGTLRDRYAYNRPEIQDLFMHEEKKAGKFVEFYGQNGSKGLPKTEYSKLLEIIREDVTL